MLKITFFLILIVSISFSENNKDITKNKLNDIKAKLVPSKTFIISKKELKYQENKRRLEIENKKIEEDGFCSCNNY